VEKIITPSQSPFPTFVMCPPTYADLKVMNNAWMTDAGVKVEQDREKFMGQWYNLYDVLSANGLVYLLPAQPELQDQTYVNCFVHLPHIEDRDVIILSNFTALGRAGEEIVAAEFLKRMGYEVHQCPYKFEGEPEFKYSGKGNLYYGGYGIRSDKKALEWIRDNFGAEVIMIEEVDKYLYHLDCSLMVLNKDNVMVCDEVIDEPTLAEIAKVAEIHTVTADEAYQGITNSVRAGDFVLNASSLDYMKPTDKYYELEERKNIKLEAICDKVSLELVYVDLSESMKGGALLSCHIAHLNHRDMLT